MAIGFDSTANGNGTASPWSWSHTVGAGLSNSIAIVGISFRGAGTVTGVTFGGSAMTQIRTDGPTSLTSTYLFYLLNPSSGAQTIQVTNGTITAAVGGSVVLSGVDQTSPVDAQNGTTGSVSPITTDVTTVANNTWIVDVVAVRTGASETVTMTAHTGRTERWNVLNLANGVRGAGSTYGPITPAGATTVDWTQAGTQAEALSAASFKPAAAGWGHLLNQSRNRLVYAR